MVWQVAKAVKIPVIGMGGIMTWSDAIEFILAGAAPFRSVQLHSLILRLQLKSLKVLRIILLKRDFLISRKLVVILTDNKC